MSPPLPAVANSWRPVAARGFTCGCPGCGHRSASPAPPLCRRWPILLTWCGGGCRCPDGRGPRTCTLVRGGRLGGRRQGAPAERQQAGEQLGDGGHLAAKPCGCSGTWQCCGALLPSVRLGAAGWVMADGIVLLSLPLQTTARQWHTAAWSTASCARCAAWPEELAWLAAPCLVRQGGPSGCVRMSGMQLPLCGACAC